MPDQFNFSTALDQVKTGKRLARVSQWPDAYGCHRSVVLVRGREIAASFEPMVTHLGEGAKFHVSDHIDCIFLHADGQISTTVGYQLSQDDLLAEDWFEVA